MRSGNVWITVAAVGLAGGVLPMLFGQNPPAPGHGATDYSQWEYKVVRLNVGLVPEESRVQVEQRLNELGAQGWELVAYQERGGYYFKRPAGRSS